MKVFLLYYEILIIFFRIAIIFGAEALKSFLLIFVLKERREDHCYSNKGNRNHYKQQTSCNMRSSKNKNKLGTNWDDMRYWDTQKQNENHASFGK